MAYRVEVSERAAKAVRKLDKTIAAKILDELEAVSRLDDPRSKGKPLTGNLAGLWRYRVGDYRIVCTIEDDILVVLVVDVEHRSKVYRKRRR